MANVTIGNSNLAQNHPRIISVVSNTTEVYQPTTNGLKLFAAVISERGSEEISQISHQTQFLNNYGQLDIKNYGQSSYNAVNWLSSGGLAVVKRILPEDAAFAHAYINIRTKTAGDKVEIQPLVSSIGNANTKDTLEYTLDKDGEINFQGYRDNLLASFTPVGRGKSYSNMGFRVYPNKQYDNFLNYRLYNFEVIEFTKEGSFNILEGPFAVSFYRDALSPVNDESIFIEDVLDKYSDYLKVSVNSEAYESVCKLICPEAGYPFIVDPIFTQTRVINGSPEKVNGKDVHYKLMKTGENQEPVMDTEGNIIKYVANSDSEFEVSKIKIEDDIARERFRYDSENKIEDMAEFIGKVKSGSEIILSEGMSATIAASTPINNAIAWSRKLLSRALVSDQATASLATELENFIKQAANYKIALSRKEKGNSLLNDFYDTLSSDLKLASNSHSLTKISFIQDKITSFIKILTDIDLANTEGLDELEAIVTTLADEFMILSEKSKIVESLLIQDSTNAESLLFKVNTVIETAKSNLNSAVLTPPRPEEAFIGAYGDIAILTATKDDIAIYEATYRKEKEKTLTTRVIFNELQDISAPVRFRDGSDGEFDLSNPSRSAAINRYLSQLFEGALDPMITSTKLVPFNFIMDANYSENVKNSIVNLAMNIRRDFIFIGDCGLNANARGDLAFRKSFNVSSNYVAIYGQSQIIYDSYSGKDVKVTTPYILASKLPTLESTVGLQNPIAGTKRGLVSGFKAINYLPTDVEQEDLYNNRVNYIVGDNRKYNLGSQLTSDFKRTPLSDLNNVITMLNIKRDAEGIVEGYQFEFIDNNVMRSMQQELNLTLNKYVTSRAADNIDCTVFATEYDRLQHTVRVNISVKFKDIIETVIVTLEVTK